MTFSFPERAPARPIWLMTLADLALLLVGFFVLLQAHGTDGHALAGALRDRFGEAAVTASPTPRPMAVAAAAVSGFAPGSAVLPHSPQAVLDWVRDAARDPRTTVTVTGGSDGSTADVDPATGNATVLAADRARALAAAMAATLAAQHIPAGRLALATAITPGRRAATVTLGFTGSRP